MSIFIKSENQKRDDAVIKFKSKPVSYLSVRSEDAMWPLHLPNGNTLPGTVVVNVGNYELADIQDILIPGTAGYAVIGHIAVRLDFTRRGIATVLARAYAKELGKRYSLNKIIFRESHKNFAACGYPQFFSSLGATIDPETLANKTPHYNWNKADW